MVFPTINTKATNITITPQLQTLLEQKLAPLGKFLDERREVLCEVELEKITDHHSGKIFRAEVNLTSGGRLFRAEATEEQMEQAIDIVRNEIKHELQHTQGKRKSLLKRGHQVLKDMMRRGK